MKRSISIFLIIFLGTSFFIWNIRTSLFQKLISKKLNNVPIYLDQIVVNKNRIALKNFKIGNFSSSKSKISLGTKAVLIDANIKEIMNNPLTIDSLILKDTVISIEYYNESGSKNNWESILKEINFDTISFNKDYLIKKIVLENLSLEVVKYDGKITKYPTIDNLEFYNLSNELGYPINKIDKAILNTIIRAIITRIGLDHILEKTDLNRVVIPHFGVNNLNDSRSGN